MKLGNIPNIFTERKGRCFCHERILKHNRSREKIFLVTYDSAYEKDDLPIKIYEVKIGWNVFGKPNSTDTEEELELLT